MLGQVMTLVQVTSGYVRLGQVRPV